MEAREMVEGDYQIVSDMLFQLYDEHSLLRPGYYSDMHTVDLGKLFSESDLKIVVENDGDIAGFARGELIDSGDGKFAVIHDIFVDASLRGKGLGSLLMDDIYSRAKLAGAESIRLQVDIKNPKAVSFWESEGFEASHYKMTKEL